ncbi:MAG: alpha/beta hydrolase, partial [Candidatus Bathyarchaeota archaeon]|nr:alpha/beta hydrolase [Candidatus Bathyarchaeota archaeon]
MDEPFSKPSPHRMQCHHVNANICDISYTLAYLQALSKDERQLTGQTLTLPDGRQLGYLTLGKGHPIIYFHGTASSRLEILLLKEIASKEKLQIIGVDRPGYGLSTFKPIKSLRDFNSDINFLADYLGLNQFGILGWSGGGVFALAYLSLFPERVTRTVVASTPTLPFDGATAHNT